MTTGDPPTPRCLHTATGSVAPRVDCLEIICHIASNLGCNLLGEMHRSLLPSLGQKILQFWADCLCPCRRVQVTHRPAASAVGGDPGHILADNSVRQRGEGSSNVHAARVLYMLDSKKHSNSASVASPSPETGIPPTPCGLHAATCPIAPGVDCLEVICQVPRDMASDLSR